MKPKALWKLAYRYARVKRRSETPYVLSDGNTYAYHMLLIAIAERLIAINDKAFAYRFISGASQFKGRCQAVKETRINFITPKHIADRFIYRIESKNV